MEGEIIERDETPLSVARAEEKLERMVDKDVLTENGKSWLTVALDPCHDGRVRCRGYPDTETGDSVIQAVRKSFTLSTPLGASTNNWDASVVMWPLALGTQEGPLYEGCIWQHPTGIPNTSDWYWSDNAPNAEVQFGGCIAQTGNVGFRFWCGGNGTTVGAEGVDLTGFEADAFRVIGMGFEVVNTTAPLNAQGLVTVYKMPYENLLGRDGDIQLSVGGTIAAPGNIVGRRSPAIRPLPPPTTAEALLLPGSKQWEAKKGVYMVSSLSDLDNPAQMVAPMFVGHLFDKDVLTDTSLRGPTLIAGTAGVNTAYSPLPNMVLPYDLKGCIFSGLSATTTLQVNAVWWIERFPGWQDTDLVTLAEPSAEFDVNAIRLASESVARLPVGVPFGMNPKGEWFEDVVDTVSGIAGPALGLASMLFPQFAPILAPAGATAGAVNQYTSGRRKQREEKKLVKKQAKRQSTNDQAGRKPRRK